LVSSPSNAFGGVFEFKESAFGANGLSRTVLCINRVPGDAAKDDLIGVSGSSTDESYISGTTYTLCYAM